MDAEYADKGKGHLIRYGNPYPTVAKTNYNTPEFIELCVFKSRFSKFMNEKGFYAPVFHSGGKPEEFPVLIRKSLTGTGGKGIVIVKNMEEFEQQFESPYFWTPFVKMSSEFRVHVLGGNFIKIFKKIITTPGVEEAEYPIRNVASGYHYARKEMHKENFKVLRQLEEKLREVFPTGFYGLDVGWDVINKRYFIIEANSAPGLNTQTVKMYAEYLVKELEL